MFNFKMQFKVVVILLGAGLIFIKNLKSILYLKNHLKQNL